MYVRDDTEALTSESPAPFLKVPQSTMQLPVILIYDVWHYYISPESPARTSAAIPPIADGFPGQSPRDSPNFISLY